MADSIDDATLTQLVEMEAESMEIDCPDLDTDTEEYRALEELFEKFSEALERTLKSWARAHPRLILDDDGERDIDAWYEALPEPTYNTFMTLIGSGVGVWDGRWDDYFLDAKGAEVLSDHLKEKLARGDSDWATDAGSGRLVEALREAAYAGCGQDYDKDPDDEEHEMPDQDELNQSVVIGDMRRGSGYGVAAEGKALVGNLSWDDALKYARAWMKKHNYFPNLYHVNIRGNIALLDPETGNEIQSWV